MIVMAWDAYLSAMKFIEALDRSFPENANVGWLYVMRNTEFKKSLLKIGMTTRSPHDRAAGTHFAHTRTGPGSNIGSGLPRGAGQ